jgi:hypothetical protein
VIMHIYAYLIDALAEIHAPSQTTLTLMITQLRCTILETSLYAFPVLLLAKIDLNPNYLYSLLLVAIASYAVCD